MKPGAPGEADLFGAVRALAATVLAMLGSRLSLAGLELAASRDRLLRALILALLSVLLLTLALALLSAWLALALWDRLGPAVLGLLAVAYAGAAALLLHRLRQQLASAPPLLADTLAELQHDARALAGQAPPRPPAAAAKDAR